MMFIFNTFQLRFNPNLRLLYRTGRTGTSKFKDSIPSCTPGQEKVASVGTNELAPSLQVGFPDGKTGTTEELPTGARGTLNLAFPEQAPAQVRHQPPAPRSCGSPAVSLRHGLTDFEEVKLR